MATSGDFHLSESLANMSNDELIEAKVLIFKEMILKSVNAMELLSLMPALITREDKMKIRHVNRHEGPSKATEELLEIIKHKTEQGRWQTLIDALRIASYENIANGLSAEGKYEPSVEQNQLVEIFSKELEDRINVTEILPHLISKDVLTTKDSEEIKAEYDNSGAQAGALLLVMRIPCKSPNWFQLFLEVLDDNQYQEIVDLLDPLFRQKRKQKYSDEEAQQSKAKKIDASSSEDEDDNGIKEDYASMSGEAYMSHDNLGAPPADDSIQNIDENTPLKRELSSQVPTEHDESLEIILNTEQRNNMSTEEVKEQIQNVNKDMEDILGFNEPPPNLPPGGLAGSLNSKNIGNYPNDDTSSSSDDDYQLAETFIDKWCTCHNCGGMPRSINRCCSSFNLCKEKMADRNITCITNLESFKVNCLNHHVLELDLHDYLDVSGPDCNGEPIYKLYKHLAYRRFTKWIWRTSGCSDYQLPTCVVKKIEGFWCTSGCSDNQLPTYVVRKIEGLKTLRSEENPGRIAFPWGDGLHENEYEELVEKGSQALHTKKEELKVMGEAVMQDAITEVQHKMRRNMDRFHQNLLKKQKKEKQAQDQTAYTEQAMNDGEFNLCCGGCYRFICKSHNIRKIERVYYAAVADDITKYIFATKCMGTDSGFGNIACKGCGSDLGNVKVYKDVQFPLMKIKNFKVKDSHENFSSCEKWNQVPFHVTRLGKEEILRQRSYPLLIGPKMSMVSEVDNRSDSDSDSEVEVNQATSELKLRSYQLELARKGLEGTNCLVVAPTGSGKTHVALKIIQEHMEKTGRRRMPKVIFLLEQSALADQQSKMCRKYLNCSVKLITGEVQRSENFRELSQWIKRYDILVVTAQLLVNALMEKDVDIKNFSLMVFDECHHANLKHAYNRIMHQYLDLKLDDTVSTGSLPQVIGLTASVGCGKAKNKYEAVEWIEKIMAHLDAEAIVTVNQHKNELMEHAIVPEQIKKVVPGRKNNLFGEAVSNLMTMIERLMAQSEYAQQNKECVRILQPPAVKGKEQYTGWVSEIWRETAQISDQRAMRFFRTCRNYLEVYNKALIIYSDARVKDALEFLDEEMSKLMALKPKNDIDEKMETLFQKSRNIMENCLYNDENPKLQELKNMLIKAYREKPDYRGIIFVRTRDLARAIESWMRDTRELKGLNPVKFVGAVSHDGMTKQEQVDVLQFFREGKHKIIIATSVAQEGLDIQECTLVIPYNYATNEIAMVQSRGRARDKDNSKYIALVEEGGQAAKKEELNIMREMMMQDAITEVQHKMSRNSDTFLQNLLDIQKQEKRARDQKAHTERTMKDGEFNLRCGRCNNFICMSYDIRKIERAHFAVTAEDITKYIVATKCVENGAQFIAHSIRSGFGKIACKACGFDLGNVTLYKEIQFPIIKIKSFIVEDAYGSRASWKKWIKVPFSVKELGEAELLRQSSYPVLIDPYN